MSNAVEDHPDIDRLRTLAAIAEPTVHARPDLAATVLRRSRRQRSHRSRYVLGAAAGLLAVATVAAAALPGRGDYFRQYQPSGAMEPTVRAGEQVIAGRELTPQHGDVVVFRFTSNGADLDVIQRVIALPGDRVACPDDGEGRCTAVTVNGQPLSEPYLAAGPGEPFPESTVPPGRLFLAGDNRDLAIDSRSEGPVSSDDVKGVAVRIQYGDDQRTIPGAPARPGPGGADTTDPQGPIPGSETGNASP